MKVSHQISKDKIRFNFTPSGADITTYLEELDTKNKYKFGRDNCFIEVPQSVAKDIHGDVLALIVILIVDAYSSSIELDFPVSKLFADAYKKATGKIIHPVDSKIEPRRSKSDYRPALTYSGGNDSTAATYLMPKGTMLYHAERADIGYRMLFNPRAGVQSTLKMRQRGYTARVVKSDYMYVRDYPGQMAHASPSIAALVWSEHDKIDSIASGDTFEEFYDLTYGNFSSRPNTVYTKYAALFKAVDMPLMNVTAGVSEVVTQRILSINNDSDVAQACVAGDGLGKPCGRCVKCFRKGFLDAVITKQPLSPESEVGLINNRHVYDALSKYPVRYQVLYAYIFNSYAAMSDSSLIESLRKKMSLSPGYSTFLDRWYSPSVKYIPKKYRREVVGNICEYIDKMTVSDYMWLFASRFTISRWNPVLVIRHHGFMRKYAALTKKYSLRIKTPWFRPIRRGGKYKIRLLRQEGLLWRDVTTSKDSEWGASDGRVGYVKAGRLIAVKPGSLRVRAKHLDKTVHRDIAIK